MAEIQHHYDLSKACDMGRLRQGINVVIDPSGFMQDLVWIDFTCGEFDRIAIYATGFEVRPSNPPPSFPGIVWWSLRAGIDGAFDDRVPIADVVTVLTSQNDLGYPPQGHAGYLMRAHGVQSSTWALLGSVNREFGSKVVVCLRILVSRSGSGRTAVAVGGAAG